MCGRYTLAAPIDEVVEVFDVTHLAFGEWVPRFNIAPSSTVPVLLQSAEGERRLGPMRWGLVPGWARDPKIGHRLINARSETIWSKPAFRVAARRRRCVVPMDGFYEWRVDAGSEAKKRQKAPFWIHRPDRGVFAAAGVWERWRAPTDAAEALVTFTILTTQASRWMRPLHDRMPVLLDSAGVAAWLDPSNDEPALKGLFLPAANHVLEAWEVSRAVNRPVNDEPELIEQIPDGVVIPSG
jgi:putative SOS response-associated peptidase YedK